MLAPAVCGRLQPVAQPVSSRLTVVKSPATPARSATAASFGDSAPSSPADVDRVAARRSHQRLRCGLDADLVLARMSGAARRQAPKRSVGASSTGQSHRRPLRIVSSSSTSPTERLRLVAVTDSELTRPPSRESGTALVRHGAGLTSSHGLRIRSRFATRCLDHARQYGQPAVGKLRAATRCSAPTREARRRTRRSLLGLVRTAPTRILPFGAGHVDKPCDGAPPGGAPPSGARRSVQTV